ncbi:cytochrome c oxidase accessory protein CcoG [Daejeonella oryzae]|uniref:cytochrome c oxidase accessory protein CcoG n=1 Tax=Daejeonella oryzae TaxID=1122943 RepID=UPI00040AE56B|nr:cytochrome c oxidase accessory protein CcoG [Daejeonella oryzae]
MSEVNKKKITDTSRNGRVWIYPKLIKGKLYQYRNIVSYFLLALLFTGPFLKINGEQLILLNILERKFVLFGVVFMPQDFYLFALAILTFIVFIILFTAIFGRLWCGWACPQTIFMEMVFRKIEYWIEGDAQQQKKLDASPLNPDKIFKKGLKHFIFIVISFFIANIFLAYTIGSDALLQIIKDPVNQHIYGFLAICIFTAVFYLVFAKVRELVCTVICPYGRLQGVLLDRKTLVVAYDYLRGEPRGHISKSDESPKGDCVDCGLCVQVCPTGIDIRKGTQLECINCTLCIDACDMVMEKTHRPTRLIGFKSEEHIAEGKPFKFSKRIYAYSIILVILISTLSTLLIQRSDISATILRASGTLYQLRENGTVSNLYNAELINKTPEDMQFEIRVSDPQATIQYINKAEKVEKGGTVKLTFFIILPQKRVNKYKSGITLNILSKGKVISTAKTTFIAPPNL